MSSVHVPPEMANNVLRLYKECLRRARFTGFKEKNTPFLVDMVRTLFRTNMAETDPEVIQQLKDDAAKALSNHIQYEADKLSGKLQEEENESAAES